MKSIFFLCWFFISPVVFSDIIIDGEIVDSIIYFESRGNHLATSKKGARGLMQIMSKTWAQESKKIYGREISFDLAYSPEINRLVGVRYLETICEYLDEHKNEWVGQDKRTLMIMSYRCGMYGARKISYRLGKLPKDTQKYVKSVLERYHKIKAGSLPKKKP